MSQKIGMVGKKFERLTVIKESGRKYSQVAWECSCSCGHMTTVCGHSLRVGDSQSCGCLQKEIAGRKASAEAKIKMSKAKKGKSLSKMAWLFVKTVIQSCIQKQAVARLI